MHYTEPPHDSVRTTITQDKNINTCFMSLPWRNRHEYTCKLSLIFCTINLSQHSPKQISIKFNQIYVVVHKSHKILCLLMHGHLSNFVSKS